LLQRKFLVRVLVAVLAVISSTAQTAITRASSGTLSVGSPVDVSITSAGETADYTFDGTQGQRVSLGVTSVALSPSPGCCGATLSITKPDGTQLGTATNFGTGGANYDSDPLPSTGTYGVHIVPGSNATGSFTLTLSTPVAGPTAFNSSTPVTITYPAQNTVFSFSGTAGQRVSVGVTNVSITPSLGSCCGGHVTIYKPDGNQLTNPSFGDGGANVDTDPLPTTGTYTVRVDAGTGTGIYTVALSSPLTGVLTEDGPGLVQSLLPGQDVRLTFSGTTGQPMTVTFTAVTMQTTNGLNAWI